MTNRFRKIESVQFSMLSEEEWRRFGVEIKTHSSPKHGPADTPYDLRLGALENDDICQRCGKKNLECPGHFGYIELEIPFINPIFINVVMKLLKCVCDKCSNPRLSYEEFTIKGYLNIRRSARLSSIEKRCKKITHCPHCKEEMQFYELGKGNNKKGNIFTRREGSKKILPLDPREARSILSRISNRSLQLFGFNENFKQMDTHERLFVEKNKSHLHAIRPEYFTPIILPVIPTATRPWVLRDGDKHDDDLTNEYNSIIKSNNRLRCDRLGIPLDENKGVVVLTEVTRKKEMLNIDKTIKMLLDNKKQVVNTNNSRSRKGLKARLDGKSGHIISNVVGKRVDFSGRTVIVAGGKYIREGEVGVPEMMAKILTIPEHVVEWNIDYLQSLVDNRKANIIKRGTSILILQKATANFSRKFQLRLGDVVERHLANGDDVLFNRQPSLRKESVQGKRVVILAGEMCFRLSLASCKAYNADYDGDEMNIHVPQSLGARAEARVLSNTSQNIVAAKDNSCIIAPTQNALLGMYILTNTIIESNFKRSEFKLRSEYVYDLMLMLDFNPTRTMSFINRAKKYYPDDFVGNKFAKNVSGKLIASLVFPYDLTLKKFTGVNDDFPIVVIKKGIIQPNSGPIERKMIGAGKNTIPHLLWKFYSPQKSEQFISEVQILTDTLVPMIGFSMSISDCFTTKNDLVEMTLAETQMKCANILASNKEELIKEREINSELNSAMGIAPVVAKKNMNRGERNALVVMKKSGMKGSDVNNGQISCFVGQQNIDGKRIPSTISGGTRTLPHFYFGDRSPEACGFVNSCYLDGLSPTESYFHAVSGRRGVVDTSVKTSETGYSQKKLIKKIEDLVVLKDGSLKVKGKIVSFLYGDDGLDAQKLIYTPKLNFPFFTCPVFVASKINATSRQRKRCLTEDELFDFLLTIGHSFSKNKIITQVNTNIRMCLYKAMFGVEICIDKIDEYLETIKENFRDSVACPGELVGMLASLAISEPLTQSTLSGFHFAGIGAKDVTLGIPRFKELYNATKNPQNSSCTIILKQEFFSKLDSLQKGTPEYEEEAKRIYYETHKTARSLEETHIEKLITRTEIKYLRKLPSTSPIGAMKYKKHRQEWWEDYYREFIEDVPFKPKDWVIELTFNIEKLHEYQIELSTIAETIQRDSDNNLFCVPSPVCIAKILVYTNFDSIEKFLTSSKINFSQKFVDDSNKNFFITRDVSVKQFILPSQIQGIKDIEKTYVTQQDNGHCFIDTKGINFQSVLNLPFVDFTKTMCDDMRKINEVLGIEAARTFIIREMTKIISFDGTYVNSRHFTLIADAMTQSGIITPINRDGISRDVGPFAKGVFEKQVDNFAESACFTESDDLSGFSASVVFGMPGKYGTGVVELVDR